jgi:hypothetical protein
LTLKHKGVIKLSYEQARYESTRPNHPPSLIEMQKSIEELCAKTDRLLGDVKSHGEKIDRIRLTLAWVAGGAAVIGAAIVIAAKYLTPTGH